VALWPAAKTDIGFRWSGTFDTTSDGLPLIGPVPGAKGIYAAYGYGGNGITFSFLAARLIGDLIAGKTLAIAGRLRHRSRRRQDRLKHGYPLKNGYGNGLPWARDVGLSNEVY
jgi:glycine/D-amino acid oxidase-like deaminating enzyme